MARSAGTARACSGVLHIIAPRDPSGNQVILFLPQALRRNGWLATMRPGPARIPSNFEDVPVFTSREGGRVGDLPPPLAVCSRAKASTWPYKHEDKSEADVLISGARRGATIPPRLRGGGGRA